MAHTTFAEATKSEFPLYLVLYPGTEEENRCIWSDLRVDRGTLPAGWFAYDVRGDDDSGEICSVEKNYVFVNHCGTLLTQKEIVFPVGRNWLPLEENDYRFD